MFSSRWIGLLSISVFALAPSRQASAPDRVTVPLIVQTNRPFVDLTFHRKDGSVRTARFLVDSGGGGFIVTEALARDLGVTWGKPGKEDGVEIASITSPLAAWLGVLPLDLNPARELVQLGPDGILPPEAKAQAEGLLPGHVLAKYHVVFDYPGKTFTLARPGVLTPRGQPQTMPVHPRSGYGRTEVVVNGTTYGMLVDTGASFTMVSEVVLKQWGTGHPEWPRHPGGFG